MNPKKENAMKRDLTQIVSGRPYPTVRQLQDGPHLGDLVHLINAETLSRHEITVEAWYRGHYTGSHSSERARQFEKTIREQEERITHLIEEHREHHEKPVTESDLAG